MLSPLIGIVASSGGVSEINTWTTKANMTTARREFGAATVGTTVYAIAGVGGTTTNEAYDTAANTWSTKTAMTAGRWALPVSAVGTVIYAIGGYTGGSESNTNYAYDTVANTWSTKAAMTTARYGLAAGVVGTTIYLIAGYGAAGGTDKNEAYDTVANTWSSKTVLPYVAYYLAGAAVSTKVYAIGGFDSSGNPSSNNYAYDTAANTWTSKAAMTTARSTLAAAAVGTKIYAIGGSTGSISAKNEAYDTVANSWTTKANMANARNNLAAAAYSGKIYALGGNAGAGTSNINEQYEVQAIMQFTNNMSKVISDIARMRNLPIPTDEAIQAALIGKDEVTLTQSWRSRINVQIWDGISDINSASAAYIKESNSWADVIYMLTIDNLVVFMQTHNPFQEGWTPITVATVDSISNQHADEVAKHYAESQIFEEVLNELGLNEQPTEMITHEVSSI